MLTRAALTIRLHPDDDVVIARAQLVGGTTLIDEDVKVVGSTDLATSGIAAIEPESQHLKIVTKSPVPIEGGGDVLDGRVYFFSKSHIYSYELPAAPSR